MLNPQRRDVIVGIDAGTSLIKTVAFTRDGKQLAESSLPNSYVTLPGGRVEQDMARTWTDTVAALRGLVGNVPDLVSRVAAIAVTPNRIAARPGDVIQFALEARHMNIFGANGICIRHAELS